MSDAFIDVAASAYNAGWSAHAYEVARQKADPSHSIIRRNPFEARLELERTIAADPEPHISTTGDDRG